MPRIRILQAVAGPDFSWNPGDEIDLPGEEASKWADGVRGELMRGEALETPEQAPEPETADVVPSSPEAEQPEPLKRPGKAASKADWLAYAQHLGLPDEDAESATTKSLIEFVEQREA